MKLVAIWREAYRDTITGTSRAVLFTLLLALTAGSLAVVDLFQVRALTQEAAAYQEAGASVSVLDAPGQIDPVACQALAEVPGVRAAGAVRAEQERLTLSTLPGAPVPVSTVTSGFAALLGAEVSPGPGVYLSDQVADAINAVPGDEVATADGPVRVAGTYQYPSDGRLAGYGYMALIPSNDTAAFDACWADIWPQSDQIQSLLYTALLISKDEEATSPTMGQLNTTLGTTFSGKSAFQGRITQFAPLAAGLIGLALGYISLRLRRLEVASHLHAGVSRRDMRSILTLETLSWILLAAVLAEVAIAVVIAADPAADRASLLLLGNRSVFLGSISAAAGAFAAWLMTRERHMFAYFKAR